MEPPFTIRQLDHIVLRVRDIEKSVAFYTMLGGEAHKYENRAFTVISLASNGQHLSLLPDQDFVPAGGKGNLEHFNIVIQARDVTEVTSYLKANGVELLNEPADEGRGVTINLHDPDGNFLELRLASSEA